MTDKTAQWIKFVNKKALKWGAEVNMDTRDMIIEGLERNRQKHGKPLCPCKFYPNIEEELKSRDNICPCKEFRETAHCHCNLFIKDPQSEE